MGNCCLEEIYPPFPPPPPPLYGLLFLLSLGVDFPPTLYYMCGEPVVKSCVMKVFMGRGNSHKNFFPFPKQPTCRWSWYCVIVDSYRKCRNVGDALAFGSQLPKCKATNIFVIILATVIVVIMTGHHVHANTKEQKLPILTKSTFFFLLATISALILWYLTNVPKKIIGIHSLIVITDISRSQCLSSQELVKMVVVVIDSGWFCYYGN